MVLRAAAASDAQTEAFTDLALTWELPAPYNLVAVASDRAVRSGKPSSSVVACEGSRDCGVWRGPTRGIDFHRKENNLN